MRIDYRNYRQPAVIWVGLAVAGLTLVAAAFLLGFGPVAMVASLIAGVLLATVLNNGGGAWDNAKKFIEEQRQDYISPGAFLLDSILEARNDPRLDEYFDKRTATRSQYPLLGAMVLFTGGGCHRPVPARH